MNELPTEITDVVSTVALTLLVAMLIYALAEFLYMHFRKHVARTDEYRMVLIGVAFSAVVGSFLGKVAPASLAVLLAPYSLWQAGLSPLAWVYGLFVYELAYWIQHWAGHKVRILWCIHSPHHAPESMNMGVGFNHSAIEMFYLPASVGLICGLLGVHPLVILIVSMVDIFWGNFLHISDNVVKRRYGILEHFMQTPSYHRVHHAQNPRYIDTNYTSITLFWDWLFGTLQPLDDKEPVKFGITRDVNTASFWDVHYGEFVKLWRDLKAARNLRAVFGYVFMPPGWSPDPDKCMTASQRQRQLADHT